MKIEELKWIGVLYETLNMSKASARLYVTQPALSQCLQRAEKEVGFTIFERSNKGLVPTEKGKVFCATALRMVNYYESMLIQAAMKDHPDLQRIAIGMAPYISACCAADLIRELGSRYPDITFSITEARTAELIEELKNNRIHILVGTCHDDLINASKSTIGRERTGIFLRKGSPAAKHAYEENGVRFLDLKYLKDEPIAITKTGQGTRILIEGLFAEANFHPHIVNQSMHITTLYRYALEGIATGIAPMIKPVKEMDKANGLVYYVPEKYKNSVSEICSYSPESIMRLLPEGIYEAITNVVRSSPQFAEFI